MNIRFLFLTFFFSILSQTQESKIQVTGTLIEAKYGQTMPYATVVLENKNTNAVITGTTTDDDGNFSIVTSYTVFLAEISFMGFQTLQIKDFDVHNQTVTLGSIELLQDSQTLQEVIVTGETSKTIFKLDKRIFNAGKDISSTGASALEVLNNVPSVNVNIEACAVVPGSKY